MVLASGSVYRKELLQKLGVPFTCASPDINEDKLKKIMQQQGLAPEEIAQTLSFEKGQQIFRKQAALALVIAGDQLVAFENQLLGKPETPDVALKQLAQLNGKTHRLITAVTIFRPDSVPIKYTHISHLKMKSLSSRELENYIALDKPIDCAGSYKIEKHGITLFESIECDDFSAIQGLPLLWLSNYLHSNYLRRSGHEFFTN